MTYKGLSIQGRGVVEYREWRGWPDIDIPLRPIATGVRVVTVTTKREVDDGVVRDRRDYWSGGNANPAVVTPEGVTRVLVPEEIRKVGLDDE